MRGTTAIGRRIFNSNSFLTNPTSKHGSSILSTSPFSTSSRSGSGRGASGGSPSGPGRFDFNARVAALGKDESDDSKTEPESQSTGVGHGRGKPVGADSILPGFSDLLSSVGRGRPGAGRGPVATNWGPSRLNEPSPQAPPGKSELNQPTKTDTGLPSSSLGGAGRGKPFIQKSLTATVEEENKHTRPELRQRLPSPINDELNQPTTTEATLPSSISSSLGGAGRGKPVKQEVPTAPAKEANRHIRASRPSTQTPAKPKMSTEDAVKNAVRLLSKGDEDLGGSAGTGVSAGRGGFAPGGRGRGRGLSRPRAGRGRREEEDDEGGFGGLYLGNDADGEKFAKKVGVEKMNKLIEGFEEMGGRVLPSPIEEAFVDAFETNCMLELEQEHLMGDLDRNPDIDEKPPMPLRDYLEKVKPFMMTYLGIRGNEEWEEAIEDTMKNVPLIKEVVEQFSGPERVTAKKQKGELERVANTIPASAPNYVNRFADRAVLSLQSNPGWGFNKKCQYMDKLAREVSQGYK